ncbi:MAG TPA: sigma-70 family RNA polymerase sigma factor [Gammaproteobacteria bacterium]
MSESVLERIASGDETAVAECIDRYGGLVWSVARRWSNNVADAEDTVQEIFLELWKSAPRYKPSAGSEAVFITTIARRRTIDQLRASERRPRTEEFDESSIAEFSEHTADQGMIAAEAEIAKRAVAELDEGQQQILLMGVVQGMTHSEISSATGKPLGTVKTHMRRGLARVRELLEQDAGDSNHRGSGP